MARIHKENPTQRQQIVMYLREHGKISAYEAFSKLFISQFWSRVSELEDRHWVFSRKRVKYTNPYGATKSFVEIRIVKEGDEI